MGFPRNCYALGFIYGRTFSQRAAEEKESNIKVLIYFTSMAVLINYYKLLIFLEAMMFPK